MPTETTYPYKIGPIIWSGRKINAFVVEGLPLGEDSDDRAKVAIVANRLLAEHPQLLAAAWSVFVKTRRPYIRVPEWQLIGSARGQGPLPASETLSGYIPEDVLRQLERISPA